MACHVVRFRTREGPRWGVVRGDGVEPLSVDVATTAGLITGHCDDLLQRTAREGRDGRDGRDALRLEDLDLLSPITMPARVLCLGANYRQHMIESGLNPDEKSFNMFFNKSSASVGPPNGDIVRPRHVRLLDYEVELALVFGATIVEPRSIEADDLAGVVAGVCMANDVSARDVQIPETQFFKGKSYRSFCPMGPVLCLLGPDEMHVLDEMQLTLEVNGEPRQQDHTGNLVHKPAESLAELTQFSDLAPGDVLLTGTPAGCALRAPPPFVQGVAGLLPAATRWRLFVSGQAKRGRYLQPGDVVTSRIVSRDGTIDLGTQRNTVTEA